jgi:hypothetical protein
MLCYKVLINITNVDITNVDIYIAICRKKSPWLIFKKKKKSDNLMPYAYDKFKILLQNEYPHHVCY